MYGYLKGFAAVCCLLAVAQSYPTAEEISNSSDVSDDAAHRMLVWPPRITRKNVSADQESLRFTSETQGIPQTYALKNTGSEEAQDRYDTVVEEEVMLYTSEDQPSNESQAVNQTSEQQSHNNPIINKNVKMTNWFNNFPKESNPENAPVDIDSIQLTTSKPQIIPLVETVAVFRNAGPVQNGNNSYHVEVKEITTNITQEAPKNQSQATSEKSLLQRNLESSSSPTDSITTEKTENDEETEVKKTHISETSLEHNTEIYGKTAAEELDALSVIDVLLRKRRKTSTAVKRSQPEFDSSEGVFSNEKESEEILESGKQYSIPDKQNINTTNVTILNTVYNTSTVGIKSNTSQAVKDFEDENNSTNSSHIHIVPLITLSEVKKVEADKELLPELQTKLSGNTNLTIIEPIQVNNSNVHPSYLSFNSTHDIHTTSESIKPEKGRNENHNHFNAENSEKNVTISNEKQSINSTSSLPAVNNSLSTNESQSLKHNQSVASFSNKMLANEGTDIKIISSYENIKPKRSDEGMSEKINPKASPNNISLATTEVQSSTISVTKYSALPNHSDKTTVGNTNEEVNATTEVKKINPSNIPQSNAHGKNLQATETEHLTEAKNQANDIQNLTSIKPMYSSTYNYTESSSKHQHLTSNGTEQQTAPQSEKQSTVTQEFTTSTEKDTAVEKDTTTEKGTLFGGFKTIAEYIGFSD